MEGWRLERVSGGSLWGWIWRDEGLDGGMEV
jgi:hypothetical protein